MAKKKKSNNLFLMLLSPFKYFCLGCYYTLYAMGYPFVFIYNLFSSSLYKGYAETKRKKDKKEVIKAVNLEMDSIDGKMKKNQEMKMSHQVKKIKKEKKNCFFSNLTKYGIPLNF